MSIETARTKTSEVEAVREAEDATRHSADIVNVGLGGNTNSPSDPTTSSSAADMLGLQVPFEFGPVII